MNNNNVPDIKQLFAEFLAGQGQNEPEAKGGTTRNVFDMGDSVAKVAKDAKGLQQNDAESDITPHTPNPIMKGKDFVVTEKAQRDDKTLNAFLKPLREYDSDDYHDRKPRLVQLMKNMGLGNFLKYDLLWGDFTAARNWGIDKTGHPTLLDKGTLNAKIYDHENAPKGVEAEYAKIERERREVKKNMPVRTHRRELGGGENFA